MQWNDEERIVNFLFVNYRKVDTSIPFLVMITADDQMNPIREVIEISELSSNGEYVKALDEEGHLFSRQFAIDKVIKLDKGI